MPRQYDITYYKELHTPDTGGFNDIIVLDFNTDFEGAGPVGDFTYWIEVTAAIFGLGSYVGAMRRSATYRVSGGIMGFNSPNTQENWGFSPSSGPGGTVIVFAQNGPAIMQVLFNAPAQPGKPIDWLFRINIIAYGP